MKEVDHAEIGAICELADLRRNQNRLDEALKLYEQALSAVPNHFGIIFNLSCVLIDLVRYEEATDYLRKALRLQPNNPIVLLNLGVALERLNRFDEAEALLEQGLAQHPNNPEILLASARLNQRRGRYDTAVSQAQRALSLGPDKMTQLDAYFELGLNFDRLNRTQEAFDAFTKGNRLHQQRFKAMGFSGEVYLDEIRQIRAMLTPERAKKWTDEAEPAARRPPIFLVGFPRSGTTLLEQIITSHPRVKTTAERSPIAAIRSALRDRGQYPLGVFSAQRAELSKWRDSFWSLAEAVAGDLSDVDVLDKLPLNTIDLGLIYRLFPDAKVIVSVRDPRDVCLSCFMQFFRPNLSMANFNDLDDTVGLYGAVMDLWLSYRELLPINWIEYRYERFLADPEDELRRIFAFLDLDWTDDIMRYRESAKRRDIGTPSYRDVFSPFYTRAMRRWQRYEKQIGGSFAPLERFVDLLGYAEPRPDAVATGAERRSSQ